MEKNRYILLITIDCGRVDHIYGQHAQTPNIDGLRQDGITFNQAFSQTNVTIPSLYSLFTSCYLATHGIYGNTHFNPLPSQSLPKILQTNGWKSAAFTGIHFVNHTLGQEFDNSFPLDRQFYPIARKLVFHVPQLKRVLHLDRKESKFLIKKGISWLGRNAHQHKCFLWIHFFDAHIPYYAPQRFIEDDIEDYAKLQSSASSLRDQLNARKLYAPVPDDRLAKEFYDLSYFPRLYKTALRYIDDELGHLFRYMKEKGLYDNTLIALTSDHGENLADYGVYCDHRKLFDTTTHVPLILKDFKNTSAGSEIDAMVQHIDLAPTILDRLNLAIPQRFWGENLWPLIKGESRSVNTYAFCEHSHNLQRSIRTEAWQFILSEKNPAKHIEVPQRKKADDNFPFEEPDALLDRNDPDGRNCLKEHPDVAKKLWVQMEEIIQQCREDHLPHEDLPKSLKKQLEGLGYF